MNLLKDVTHKLEKRQDYTDIRIIRRALKQDILTKHFCREPINLILELGSIKKALIGVSPVIIRTINVIHNRTSEREASYEATG